MKKQTGITLIALIITIIVLLILVTVVMSNKNDDVILENANEALTKEELEEIEIIKKYILGKNKKGILITDIAEMSGSIIKGTIAYFIDDKETEINEFQIHPVFHDLTNNPYISYVKFNNMIYKITYDATTYVTESVEMIYKFEGREGTEVKYDSNGDGIDEDWVIITDRDGKVEILSKDVAKDKDGNVLTLTLGSVLSTTDISGDGKLDDIDTAILSYNSAITTINDFCKSIVKKEIKDKVRSVGGTNNAATPYSSEDYDKWGKNIKVEVASGDENYKDDYEKMKYLEILHTNEEYWIASRTASFAFGMKYEFGVRCVLKSGILGMTRIWSVDSEHKIETKLKLDGYLDKAVRLVIVDPPGI